MKIERDRVYLNHNGAKIRVVCVDAPGSQPVVGVFESGEAANFSDDGQFMESAKTRFDLISEYTPPAPLLECWVNVDATGAYGAAWASKDGALENRGKHCRTAHFREVRDDHA